MFHLTRRDSRPANPRRRGFTLIETVVVLFLLSLLSLIVVEAYRAGLGMWERQHRDSTSLETVRALLERIRTQVKSAYPWSFRDNSKLTPYVRGRRESLEFTTLVGLSSRRESGIIHAVRYALEEHAEGKGIRVEEYGWPRRGFPDGEEPLIGETVAGVEGLEFKYQIERKTSTNPGRASAEGARRTIDQRWADDWPGAPGTGLDETLTAILVSIKMKSGDGTTEEFSAVIPVMRDWRAPPAP